MPVLGIDIGTQSLKAAILGDDLAVLGSASRTYQPVFPKPGWAEQDPRLWLNAMRPAIGEALHEADLPPSALDAMAICGQLDGCVAVDRAGMALGPAIIWMDRRAIDEIVAVDPKLVRERSGLVLDPTHMAAKIAWLSRNLSEPVRVATWHQPVSFVVAALTGQSVMSHSLASTTMLYNLADGRWDGELLKAFGIDARKLPALAGEVDIAGPLSAAGAALTGLAEGLPVAVGTGDDFSNPLGCGLCRPGVVAVSLGTAETVGALSAEATIDPALLVETHAYPGGHFHLGNPGWLSGGAVRWASRLLAVSTDVAFSALAEKAPPGSDGLTFIPALSGAMSPKWIATARGSFIGLSTSHGPEHLARAVFEGTAFAMRDVVDRLEALGVPTERLRLMGGGAHSQLWCQIRSDVSRRPADVLVEADASTVGAGLMAAVAAGITPDIATASASMKLDLRQVLPDPATSAAYEGAYQAYRTRFAALEPTWSAAD